MNENPLKRLQQYGQSVWMDYIHRDLLRGGGLQRMIEEDGLRGVTSNPTIFDKAIEGSDTYDDDIKSEAAKGRTVEQICTKLLTDDVRAAADIFRPVYLETGGRDGFVSHEVNPHLAHDVAGTISEAHKLWSILNRPNVFIKVPATTEGLRCIGHLITEGINVNVTLLFGLERYRMVMDAYISGLENRLAAGLPIDSVASVASFFLSRIDTLVDGILERAVRSADKTQWGLRGEAAIACARLAYEMYRETFEGERFRKLEAAGAHKQRILWASTSTKNPDYSDVKYVEALIGSDTVNTMPIETLEAYRDHGNPAPRLEEGIGAAAEMLERLALFGINMENVAIRLEDDGIEKFNKGYDNLMESLRKKRRAICLEEAC